LGPHGDLQPISGFGAKLPEHAARIAGVLSLFENPDATNVNATALQNGITLSHHYAAAALRLHGQSRINDDLVKAAMLLEWARQKSDRGLVSLPDIVQTGPSRIRDTATARKLAGILEQHRYFIRVQGTATVNGEERARGGSLHGGNQICQARDLHRVLVDLCSNGAEQGSIYWKLGAAASCITTSAPSEQ